MSIETVPMRHRETISLRLKDGQSSAMSVKTRPIGLAELCTRWHTQFRASTRRRRVYLPVSFHHSVRHVIVGSNGLTVVHGQSQLNDAGAIELGLVGDGADQARISLGDLVRGFLDAILPDYSYVRLASKFSDSVQGT